MDYARSAGDKQTALPKLGHYFLLHWMSPVKLLHSIHEAILDMD